MNDINNEWVNWHSIRVFPSIWKVKCYLQGLMHFGKMILKNRETSKPHTEEVEGRKETLSMNEYHMSLTSIELCFVIGTHCRYCTWYSIFIPYIECCLILCVLFIITPNALKMIWILDSITTMW